MAPARQRPSAPEPQERPLGELFSELTENIRGLVQREIELAKLETKDQISKGTKAAGMFAGTGVTAFVALLLLSFAAAWGLAELIAPGWAFLIVGVIYLAVAGILFSQGKSKLKQFKPVPQQTMQTIKQDVQVAKTSLSEGASEDSDALHRQWSAAGTNDQASRRS